MKCSCLYPYFLSGCLILLGCGGGEGMLLDAVAKPETYRAYSEGIGDKVTRFKAGIVVNQQLFEKL